MNTDKTAFKVPETVWKLTREDAWSACIYLAFFLILIQAASICIDCIKCNTLAHNDKDGYFATQIPWSLYRCYTTAYSISITYVIMYTFYVYCNPRTISVWCYFLFLIGDIVILFVVFPPLLRFLHRCFYTPRPRE